MSDPSASFTLEEYKIQREYREEKRKQYLMRFQAVRQQMGLGQPASKIQTHPAPIKKVQPTQPVAMTASNTEEDQAKAQNDLLRGQLAELEQEERKKLGAFKEKIEVVKTKYIAKIKSISEISTAKRDESEARIKKLESQIENATKKNQEIEVVNKQLSQEIGQGDSLMLKYTEQINKEYSDKLGDFEKIFESSSEKIEAMQKQYDQNQFVENTLKNEELIETIRENADKSDDIDKILEDYQELLEGKTEILQQLGQNNDMKEKEIGKMGELEEKLKSIFEKLNEEKKMYLTENSKMAEELMEVKNLLMSTMGQAAEDQ